MTFRTRGFESILLAAIAACAIAVSGRTAAADAVKGPAADDGITVTLKINDRPSGLTVSAAKRVPVGSNALQVMQQMVSVTTRTHPAPGEFVTSLCGVDPPPRSVWTFTVDGQWSHVGIGRLVFERDTLVEWQTQR